MIRRFTRSLALFAIEFAVQKRPHLFLAALNSTGPDLMQRSFIPPDRFSWEALKLGASLENFEDLLPLFFLGPANRGLMRLDFDEALLLYRSISTRTTPRGVEIGRFNGGSTLLMALAVGPQGLLTSIDIAPRADSELSKRLSQFGFNSRVELLVADANTVDYQELLDFVFIDGDHSYEAAKKDHDRWTPLLKPGGLAIYHDMARTRPLATQIEDLDRLRKKILIDNNDTLQLVEEAGSISVFRRR